MAQVGTGQGAPGEEAGFVAVSGGGGAGGEEEALALLCCPGWGDPSNNPPSFCSLLCQRTWDSCPTCDPDSSVAGTPTAYKQGGV